jgi:hypothetical protein
MVVMPVDANGLWVSVVSTPGGVEPSIRVWRGTLSWALWDIRLPFSFEYRDVVRETTLEQLMLQQSVCKELICELFTA